MDDFLSLRISRLQRARLLSFNRHMTLEAAKCDMRTRRSSVLLNPAILDERQNGSNPWTRQTTPSKSPISRNRKLAASVRRIKLGSGPLCGMPRRMAYSLPAFTWRLHVLRSSLGVIIRVATLLTFLPSTDDSQHTAIA